MSDCIGPINIIPDNNQVVLLDNNKSITVVDNNCCTNVDVTQPITSVVQILTGPIGATGEFPTSGSFNLTGSINVSGSISANYFNGGTFSGSFIGNFSGSTTDTLQDVTNNGNVTTLPITASSFYGNGLQIVGNATVTGSLTVSGSNTFKNIGPAQFTGSVDVTGSGTLNGYPLLTSNNTGSLLLSSSFNQFTSSYYTDSASFNTRILNNSSSVALLSSSYIASSASFNASIASLTSTTSSYVLNAQTSSMTVLSASYAQTASYVLQAVSSSFASTASYYGGIVTSASYASSSTSSSYASSSTSASLAQTASYYGGTIVSSSYAFNSTSASYALTASYVANASSFPYTGSAIITGSLVVTGSTISTGGFTGSLSGTATTASYVILAQTASYVTTAQTASYTLNAVSASYASTASYLNTLTQDLTFNGNLTLNGTASIIYLNVYYESSSIIYSSGSNQLGDATNDIQTLIGTVKISGSLEVTGSANIPNLTGSLFGTASNAITASYVQNAQTASYVLNAISASYALTASYSKNLQISGSINNVDYIDFNTGSVVTQPTLGRLSWNNTDGTLDIGLKGGNVTLQVGQEEVIRVVNKTGANLLEADYRVVRVRSVAEGGTQGQRLAIVLAQGDNDANSATTLGIVTENIDDNQEGFITTAGQVRGINTTGTLQGETWTDGDMIYLSPTTPGYLTNIKPVAPQHMVIIGYVIYAHNNQGKIFVKVDNGYEIDELHNVRINTGSLTSGQLLVRSGSVWTNSNQLTGSYGLTGSLTATSFTGSLFGTSSWANNATTASYVNPLNQTVIITGSLTVSGSSTLRNIGPAEFTGSLNVTGSTTLNGTLNVDNKYYFINTLSDLPTPVGNIITLADNATYFFTTTVDLLGNRLVCGQNTTLLGGSSENSRIKSTGLTTEPLISSSYSIPMRGLTIEADIALSLIASGSTQAIDWFGVNFTNCPTVGIIKDYSNVIMLDCAFLEAANCVFDGTIGTVGFVTCLFNGRSGQTTIRLSTTGSITRRFRPVYSSFIALSGETALNIPGAAIVNAEGYILDTCNFSGGGTYLTGANTESLKSLFVNNVGITNTTNVGHYYMINNNTATTIGVPNINVFVKVAGTTTIGIGNSAKWVGNGNNRIDYSGSISQDFKLTAVGTVQTSTTNQVISVAVAKNGTFQAESEITVRTAVANQPYPFAVQDLVAVAAGDFVEVFVRNTSSTNVVVGDLNVIIDKIGS